MYCQTCFPSLLRTGQDTPAYNWRAANSACSIALTMSPLHRKLTVNLLCPPPWVVQSSRMLSLPYWVRPDITALDVFLLIPILERVIRWNLPWILLHYVMLSGAFCLLLLVVWRMVVANFYISFWHCGQRYTVGRLSAGRFVCHQLCTCWL